MIYGNSNGFDADFDLNALDGTNGIVIEGDPSFVLDGSINQTGVSLAGIGEFNGNGFSDILICADGTEPDGIRGTGSAYLLFGGDDLSAYINLADIDGTSGFRFDGTQPYADMGREVVFGDINGDGLDDMIVGAVETNVPGANDVGRLHVIFGTSDPLPADFNPTTLDGTNGFSFSGTGSRDRIGLSVDSGGDFNSDGFDDIIVGSVDDGAYVIFGGASSFPQEFAVTDLDGTNGFRLGTDDATDCDG